MADEPIKVTGPAEREILIRHPIKELHTFEVTEDDLTTLQLEFQQTSQDLTFATTSFSVFITLVAALLTTASSDRVFLGFIAIAAVAFVVALYTGIRWYRRRRVVPQTIQKIRARTGHPSPPSPS